MKKNARVVKFAYKIIPDSGIMMRIVKRTAIAQTVIQTIQGVNAEHAQIVTRLSPVALIAAYAQIVILLMMIV